MSVSAKGWAQMFLKENPWSYRRRGHNKVAWEQRALQQGHIAVNSILRDWIKGQITAVETGIMSFEAVFFAHMLTRDGRSVLEVAAQNNLLAAPQQEDAR